MAALPVTHPSADVLRAFALGKLNDSSAAALMSHLDSCAECCRQVAALSGDDFLKRLRQARSHSSTPAPAKASSETAAGAKRSPNQPAIANLPPELANNPQYEILRELGRGGMGVVYLAKNKLMDRFEVLKVVNKTLLDHPGAVERFLREIRSAAKLSHANVVGAYSALQMGELLAFAMEYVEGQDLASLVKSQGALPIVHACYYVQQAALGLQHAFEKGMVHRDIKPQNLILAREGKKHIVKVLDFGLAKATREKTDDTGLTGEGKMLGTPDYIAPEQTLDAAKADIRADIYSLGCTLYYLLSGRPPFSASSLGAMLLAHQMHEAKPLNLVRPEVPEELVAVVRKMMAKSSAKRYQTPLEVVQALAPFVKQGATARAAPELSSGTSQVKPASKVAAPVAPPPAPVAEVPMQQPEPAAVWESLTENSAASIVSKQSGIVRKPRAATVRERTPQQKWLLGGGIGVGVLLLALLGMWAGGVFKVKTKDGTIVLRNVPADAEVLVDDGTVTVRWGNGNTAEIRVTPRKKHRIQVKKEGFKVFVDDEVEVDAGGKKPLLVRLEKLPEPIPPAPPPLPPEKQVEAVVQKLRNLNPGFDGTVKPTIENGNVTSLEIVTDHVTDISPLRALPGLKFLSCKGSRRDKGKLADLSPLKGMHLTRLQCDHNNRVSDLSPLKDMKLTSLGCRNTPVSDLSPLKDMKLTSLDCCGSRVSDLSPLKDMKLTVLIVEWTRVSDLSPLKGMNLTLLDCGGTPVSDLSPLKGMKLTFLNCSSTRASDISPLKGMPLREVYCDRPERDTEILRSIKTLERINGKAAAQFWKEVDGRKTSDGSPTKTPPNGYDDLAKGRWVAVLSSDEEFNRLISKKAYRAEKVYKGAEPRFVGGVFHCDGGNLSFPSIKAKDAIVRAWVRKLGPKNNGNLHLWLRNGIGAWFNGGGFFGIGRMVDRSWKDLASCQLSEPYDDYFEFAFAAVGDRLIAYANGQKILEAQDHTPPNRTEEVGVGTHTCKGLFRNIQVQVLDKPSVEAKGPPEDKGFKPLFNGKDLTGWKVFGGGTGNWKVVDGAIVGSGPMSHLFSERGDYENFHFVVEAMINSGGNSGQYFRTEYGPRFPKGYEAQINSTHRDPIRGGSLYPSFGPPREDRDKIIIKDRLYQPDEWFTQEVIAVGNHIVIKVNDKTTVDFVDKKNTYKKGHFALQQHSLGTVVKFRKVEIKELGKGKIFTTASGLKYEDLEEGTGAVATYGDTVEVHYTGWLTNGKKFDSSHDRKKPFSFKLGDGKVIKGWEKGVAGMKVGGKRKLTIPPELAYGKRGAGGVIPPDATLIFEIELLKIK